MASVSVCYEPLSSAWRCCDHRSDDVRDRSTAVGLEGAAAADGRSVGAHSVQSRGVHSRGSGRQQSGGRTRTGGRRHLPSGGGGAGAGEGREAEVEGGQRAETLPLPLRLQMSPTPRSAHTTRTPHIDSRRCPSALSLVLPLTPDCVSCVYWLIPCDGCALRVLTSDTSTHGNGWMVHAQLVCIARPLSLRCASVLAVVWLVLCDGDGSVGRSARVGRFFFAPTCLSSAQTMRRSCGSSLQPTTRTPTSTGRSAPSCNTTSHSFHTQPPPAQPPPPPLSPACGC